jgi:hypothetical protein
MIPLDIASPEIASSGFELFEKLGAKFFIRFSINIVFVFLLIRLIYLPIYKNKEKIFTFIMFNIIIFLITFALNKVEMSMGAAFGLFAVFTMLRYRTEDISTTDMTYMFLMIAMGLINSVSKGSWDELILLDSIIFTATYLLESNLLIKKEISMRILYDNVELLRPENRKDLIEDIEQRMGIKVNHLDIGKVDFLRDMVQIIIYYNEK